VVLDVYMPRRSGLEILEAIGGSDYPAPILIISGQGDIPMAVSAIRAGAQDFIEKPFEADKVIERVRKLVAVRRRNETRASKLGSGFPGANLLTPREREVLEQIARGASSKEAGRVLGISFRTIEVHRGRIMETGRKIQQACSEFSSEGTKNKPGEPFPDLARPRRLASARSNLSDPR
jgi:two-component system response regulator FixJ